MTPKQRAFIAEYLKDFNATQAAIRAGYSPKTASVIGHQNLKKLYIATEIERLVSEREMNDAEVRLRLGKIARFDMSKYIKQYGALLGVDTEALVADGHGDMIRKVYQTKDGPRIEFADPEWALDKIAKVLGMYVDRREITGADGGPIEERVRFIDYGLEDDDESTD